MKKKAFQHVEYLVYTTVLCFLFNFSVRADIKSDSTKIQQLIQESIDLVNQAQFTEASKKLDSSKLMSEAAGLWELYYSAEVSVIEILWNTAQFEEARVSSLNALEGLRNKLGPSPFWEAELYHQLATTYLLQAEYDSTIKYFNEAIELRLNIGDRALSGLSASYSNLGATYGQLGDVNKQLDYFIKALEIDRKFYGEEHLYVAYDLSNIGAGFQRLELNHKGLTYFVQALEILKKIGNTGGIYSNVLYNIGTVYQYDRQLETALEYLSFALKNNIKLYGEEHYTNANICAKIADNFYQQQLIDSSIWYYDKALSCRKQLELADRVQAISIYQFIYEPFVEIGRTDEAIKLINDAISLSKEISDENNYLAFSYNNLGLAYEKIGAYDEAKANFQKALNIYTSLYGTLSPASRASYRNLAAVHLKINQYDSALLMSQNSLKANTENWNPGDLYTNPAYDSTIDKLNYMLALQIKSEALFKKYKLENKGDDVEAALDTYKLLDQSLKRIRKSFFEIKDKRMFQEVTDEMYDAAFHAHFELYQRTGDKKHLSKCFYYSQSGKVGSLQDVLNRLEAAKWSSLPSALVEEEEALKADYSYYKTQLNLEKEKPSADQNSDKINLFEKKIFESKYALDSISLVLENEYPSYYSIKYDTDPIIIGELQKSLSSDQIVLEYTVTDSVLYVMRITQNDLNIHRLENYHQIKESINQFRFLMSAENPAIVNEDRDKAYEAIASELYTKLIEDGLGAVQNNAISELVIVPNAELGFLPFELLLTEEVGVKEANYESYPYLFHKYAVSYSYSSSFLLNQVTDVSTNEFVGFAPVYESLINNDEIDIPTRFRSQLRPLKWNTQELTSLNSLMNGNAFVDSLATERNFKDAARQASILHLSMHALIDDNNPMNSKLIFFQDEDSIEDGFLHTFEIFNLNINAQMAVLSACQTGVGEFVDGDGVMSLAQGFAYAGVPSIVMSHWNVDDASTNQLMQQFYNGLSEQLPKSEALRQAKIDYLNEANPNKKHPFFWGAFVSIGDNSPIIEKEKYSWFYYIIVPILLITIIYGVIRFRQKVT
ncbi:MAG: CHAT domain-containing tetratricopeptide repeat protein [Bacteroidota bacterium]